MTTAQRDSLLTIRLEGDDPRTWGVQHGEAFAAEIHELAEIRNALLANQLPGWNADRIGRLCEDQLSAMRSRWPDVLAELEGISEASGVSLRDLVVVNAYTDLKDFAAEEAAPAEDNGCSSVAAKGPAVNFSAQTWDMHVSAEPFTVLIEVPGPTMRAWVLSVTGCLGMAGVNEAGVSVMINNLQCRETDRGGIIWPGLVRLMLQESSAKGAARVLSENLPSSGHNYLIADRHEAIDIETTGRRTQRVAQIDARQGGAMGHTNHYLSPLKEVEIVNRVGPTSRPRMAAIDQFFAEHPLPKITAETVRRGFLEAGPLCDCVSIIPKPGEKHASATCGGIGVDHSAGRAFAWRGRYEPSRRIEWMIS
jgi:isopenicillin-N N-acyltransferase-like protein